MDDRAVSALAELPDVARARAAAEAVEWSLMLRACEALESEYAGIDHPHERLVASSAVPLEIAVATGWSEFQVQNRLAAAKRMRALAPVVWLAFQAGRLDAARVMAIAGVVEKLTRPESLMALDQSVVTYAESHTGGELKAWLKWFLASHEPDLAGQRAERERGDRHVRIEHTDDSMAYLTAYIPSVAAAAIDRRLTKHAKQMHGDERTLEQRRADLLMAWLTHHEGDTAAIGADIAVVVPAEVLAGASDELAVSADGRWITPASWLFDYARAEQIFWHRLLYEPAGGVLDYTFLGRFAPERLDTAICLRDRVCRAPGCLKPARECDQDHLIPYPEGPTNGRNMGPLCRRHHRMKSHGVLTWALPSGQQVPADRHAHAPPDRQPSEAEHTLATLIIEHTA